MNVTYAIIISAVIAFGVTAGLGFIIIPWLRKLKFGQTILEIGPRGISQSRALPIWAALCLQSVSWLHSSLPLSFSLQTAVIWNLIIRNPYGRENVLLIAGVALAVGCGLVGFCDDFIKIKLKRNEGLSAKQKTLGQF